jgi:hypothetical protein
MSLRERPFIRALVNVPQPLEIGRDFIARTFFSYGYSTEGYDADEADPPRDLAWLRDAAEDALGSPQSPRGALLEDVLERSLLKPSGKVFFDDKRFVVVEPHVSPDELQRWADLEHDDGNAT